MRSATWILICVLWFLAGFSIRASLQPDPFSQRNFPCQEDEVLMFIDTVGKDRTGCVNIEILR